MSGGGVVKPPFPATQESPHATRREILMKYKTKQNSEEHTFSLFKGDSSVFSQRVSAHTYHIFIDDYIGPPCQYRECVETLMNAELQDMVVIHINSDGGELASALEIINAM